MTTGDETPPPDVAMAKTEFSSLWNRFYGSVHPVAWEMRDRNVEHWVRFHSLPESKRYAETRFERETIFERWSTLADRLLGPGERCWLVRSRRLEKPRYAARHAALRCHEKYSGQTLRLFDQFPDEEEELDWRLYVAPCSWDAKAFRYLLRAIARDTNKRLGNFLWVAVRDGTVFAPYDGGVDLFLPSSDDRNALKAEFSDWLSDEPSGL